MTFGYLFFFGEKKKAMVLGCYHLHKILFCQDEVVTRLKSMCLSLILPRFISIHTVSITRLCLGCLRPIINQTYHEHANASENDLTVFMEHTPIHELPRDFSPSVILSDIDSSN